MIFRKLGKFWRDIFTVKIHSSWLIAALCGGFLSGVYLSLELQNSFFANNFWLVFVAIFLVFIFISRLRIMIFFAIITGIILGIWRGMSVRIDLNIYEEWIGQNVILRGKIKEDPDFGASGDLRLKIVNPEIILSADYNKLAEDKTENIEDYFTLLPGTIWASAFSGKEAKRSDQVEISGKLKAGFGVFPATISFGKLTNIFSSPNADPARDIRNIFGEYLRKIIPSPESDLGMGILAGQKTALPLELSSAFMIAGLTHIVVASGYNLTILIRFARRLFAKISRFAALGFGGILVFSFACVTGFSPSMTRASLVAGLSLLAWYYGRKFHPVVLITFVAAITIMLDPSSLWGDAGWWMSFTSFVGVIILAPLVKSYFWGNEPDLRKKPSLMQKIRAKFQEIFAKFKLPFTKNSAKKFDKSAKNFGEKSHTFRGIFIETLSAQIMASPIIALFMGQFSPFGLLANLAILWLLPLTMLLTFIAGIGAFILPHFLAEIVAFPANFLLNYIIEIARFVAELPGASQSVNIGFWPIIGIYFLIFIAIIYLKNRTKYNFRDNNIVE